MIASSESAAALNTVGEASKVMSCFKVLSKSCAIELS
jgi:hypothetical protein